MNTWYLIVILSHGAPYSGVANNLLTFESQKGCEIVKLQYEALVKHKDGYYRISRVSPCFKG